MGRSALCGSFSPQRLLQQVLAIDDDSRPGVVGHGVELAVVRAGLEQALRFFEVRLGTQNRRLLPILRNIARGQRFQGQLPAAIRSVANGINSEGDISGNYTSPDCRVHGFVLTIEGFFLLDLPTAEQELGWLRDDWTRVMHRGTQLASEQHPRDSTR